MNLRKIIKQLKIIHRKWDDCPDQQIIKDGRMIHNPEHDKYHKKLRKDNISSE